jgi:hypothetical protein
MDARTGRSARMRVSERYSENGDISPFNVSEAGVAPYVHDPDYDYRVPALLLMLYDGIRVVPQVES